MKSSRKAGLLTTTLIAATMFTFLGSIAGSISWFNYVTKATMSYSGTSVTVGEQLQIGIKTNKDLSSHGLVTEVIDTVSYAWAQPGKGIDSDAINGYLGLSGYATNELKPVSSNEYHLGDTLSLTECLISGHAQNDNIATKDQYVQVPFVFRIIRTNEVPESPNYYARNQKVWISDADANPKNILMDGEIYKSIRVHVNGDSKFIFNPSAEGGAASNAVGGLLDLNDDGFYDHDDSDNEIVYGHVTNPSAARTYYAESSEVVDVNGVGNTDPTTFVAKHLAGTSGYDNMDALSPLEADYETLNSIKPIDDGTGVLSGGKQICTTANTVSALGEATLTIYIEGWDHHVVNEEISHRFNLGLTFQINRVD